MKPATGLDAAGEAAIWVVGIVGFVLSLHRPDKWFRLIVRGIGWYD